MPAARRIVPLDDQALREYLKDLRADLRYWYTSAEAKAQLVLTANGVFVTFLTAAALGTGRCRPGDISVRTGDLDIPRLDGLMPGPGHPQRCHVRRVPWDQPQGTPKKPRPLRGDPDKAGTYAPELAVFFGYLSKLEATPLVERLHAAGQDFIIQALASDIIEFAPNIVEKHRSVNRAFVLTGMTLGSFSAPASAT